MEWPADVRVELSRVVGGSIATAQHFSRRATQPQQAEDLRVCFSILLERMTGTAAAVAPFCRAARVVRRAACDYQALKDSKAMCYLAELRRAT